jgi:YidC/Oxa1 family membrane protein insertase
MENEDMDRRTLLAFGLIFLLYVGWIKLYEHWYGPPAGQAPADSVAVSATATEDSAGEIVVETAASPQPSSQGASESNRTAGAEPVTGSDEVLSVLEPSPPPRSVLVRTPLYDVRVSSMGARITSWTSHEFKGPEGGAVQLIPQEEERAATGGDAIVFTRQEWDLGTVPFGVEGPSEIDLTDSEAARSLVFAAETAGGLRARKIFTFHPGRYDIDVDLEIAAAGTGESSASLLVTGDPVRVRFGWSQGIASTEKNKKWEDPMFRSFAMVGEEAVFKKRLSMRKDPAGVRETLNGSIRFVGQQNRYFHIAAWVPLEPGEAVEGSIHLDADAARNQQTWWIEVPLRRLVAAGDALASARIELYLGPSDYDLLKSYGRHLEKTLDLGWKLFRPLSELVLTFMNWLHRWIPNYGVIIIILSILTKGMFYPLTRTSTRSMKRMQEVQPKIKALQEKYKDNREKLSQEMMKLYREEKINPMASCLPLLVQSPVFIALYQVLRQTIALRQAPFMLWIHDLAQPDALFQFPVSLPLFGQHFNLLPILMSLSMYFQTKITPTTGTGGQMAIMNTMMPVMMLVFFYNMPSGLVIYWLVNTLMTIYQTWRIHQTAPATGGAQAA